MQFSNGRASFRRRQGRFNRLRGKKEEGGRKGPKSFRWVKTISKGLTDCGRRGAELLHLSCMGREGGRGGRQSPLPPCNSLPLLPSTSPGNNSASPKTLSYLLSGTPWGRRGLRIWLLFLLLPPLMGAMWVPQLSLTSPKAFSGSHNSSFLRWRRRQSVHAAETPTPLLPHHQSWRSAASDYYLVPPMLKSSLKGNTSNRSITAPPNPHA